MLRDFFFSLMVEQNRLECLSLVSSFCAALASRLSWTNILAYFVSLSVTKKYFDNDKKLFSSHLC
jgi:hypothetical protein